MGDLKNLCEKINMPDEMSVAVIEFSGSYDFGQVQNSMGRLFSRKTWESGLSELKSVLGEDVHGVRILTCMLLCALRTAENYKRLGIGETIYIDTMKCFSRFVCEHKESYGIYGFDREWWTARQISGQLLRIGELEYEMVEEDEKKYISIHIPSDAVLKEAEIRSSYQAAKRLFEEVFTDYASAEMVCHSWLLSPTLKELLEEGSHILAFQRLFDIEPTGQEETEYMQWVFKNPNLPLGELPEQTSLQRNLKRYLLEGNTVAGAGGRLLENLISSYCENKDSGIRGE